jgi:hypothetical protein
MTDGDHCAWRVVLALPLLAGCSTPESRRVPDPRRAPDPAATARIAVRIEFEPALLAPGTLHYAHECGESGDVATGCAAVDLSLPPGPVVLTLLAAGRRHEMVLRIPTATNPWVWRLGD